MLQLIGIKYTRSGSSGRQKKLEASVWGVPLSEFTAPSDGIPNHPNSTAGRWKMMEDGSFLDPPRMFSRPAFWTCLPSADTRRFGARVPAPRCVRVPPWPSASGTDWDGAEDSRQDGARGAKSTSKEESGEKTSNYLVRNDLDPPGTHPGPQSHRFSDGMTGAL